MGYRLKWVDNNLAEDGYRVYRGEAPLDIEDLPVPLATLGPDTTQYDDTTALPGVEYFYRVSAFAGSQEAVSLEVNSTEAYGDPHWDKVVGLYRVLGETIVDLSSLGKAPLTNTGLISSPLETPIGAPAMYLQPNRKAVFSMPALRTDDFTIEFFHRAVSINATWPRVVSTRDQEDNHSTGHNVQMSNTGAYGAWFGTQNIGLTAAGSAASGTFRHLAICRSQGQYRFYMDGILVSSKAGLVDDTNNTFIFGHGNGSRVDQWFSEVRVTKGVARYTGDFTPPTEPFLNFGPFSPRNIAPALWLDAADAGTVTLTSDMVSQWADKSGENRHATQGTAGNRPGYTTGEVAFDSDDFLTLATAANSMFRNVSDAWVFAVFKRDTLDAGAAVERTIFAAATATTSYRVGLNLGGGAEVNCIAFGGRRMDSGPYAGAYSTTPIGTDWCMVMGYTNYTEGLIYLHIDGALDATSAPPWAPGPTQDTQSQRVRIGAHVQVPPTNHFDGEIREVITGNTPVSQADIDKLFGYTAWKWGLVDKLPEDHPYKHQKPMENPT